MTRDEIAIDEHAPLDPRHLVRVPERAVVIARTRVPPVRIARAEHSPVKHQSLVAKLVGRRLCRNLPIPALIKVEEPAREHRRLARRERGSHVPIPRTPLHVACALAGALSGQRRIDNGDHERARVGPLAIVGRPKPIVLGVNDDPVSPWIHRGAHIYICGDESRMAKDVHQALLTVIQEQGKQTPEQATETLDQLRRDGRYQKDVY